MPLHTHRLSREQASTKKQASRSNGSTFSCCMLASWRLASSRLCLSKLASSSKPFPVLPSSSLSLYPSYLFAAVQEVASFLGVLAGCQDVLAALANVLQVSCLLHLSAKQCTGMVASTRPRETSEPAPATTKLPEPCLWSDFGAVAR